MTEADTPASTQDWVTETCRELGLPVVSADDDFFDLGGTSLTATRLIAKVDEVYGVDALPPDDLFSRSTIRELAQSIDANRSASAAADA
jgi:non-haem Fe2+, alpha-ketoglutarate-dependent halogenase